MQTIRMMPCIARFFTAAALMSLFSHLVVSENSIVVRQNLGTFDSFEISDLARKAHELSERLCNNVTSAGHIERGWNLFGSQALVSFHGCRKTDIRVFGHFQIYADRFSGHSTGLNMSIASPRYQRLK